jgi:hypothetical protein
MVREDARAVAFRGALLIFPLSLLALGFFEDPGARACRADDGVRMGKVNARGVAFAAFRKYFFARMWSVRARVAFANARAAERYFLFFSFHLGANKGPSTGAPISLSFSF